MARKNRPVADPVRQPEASESLADHFRHIPPGDPNDPFERLLSWIRRDHEPTPAEVLELARELYRPLPQILQLVEKLMSKLDALTAAVAQSNTVAESAITLLTGLKTELDTAIAADDDGDALQALSDNLGAETTKLAAAITANTPTPVASTDPAAPAAG